MEQEKKIKIDSATIWPNGKFEFHEASSCSTGPSTDASDRDSDMETEDSLGSSRENMTEDMTSTATLDQL